MKRLSIFSLCIVTALAQDQRFERSALPATVPDLLFRKHVDPDGGGKIPEAAHARAELNKLDSEGFANNEVRANAMVEAMRDMPLPEKMGAAPLGLPGPPHSPSLPPYAPPGPAYGHPAPAYGHPEPTYGHPEPAYGHPEPAYGHPEPAYGHPEPAYGAPEPGYGPPKPGYGPPKPYKPKEPVLLDHKPYAPKDIKPVTVTTFDAYTSFDCRGRHYDTFYADEEAHCQIYHFCHADGKIDTHHCPYGTIFNEYIGTCDHNGAAKCHSGEGYKAPPPPPHKPGYHEPPAAYHAPAPYHPEPAYHSPAPAPYHPPSPAPYHPTPAPYHPPPTTAPYHAPAPAYHTPAPYHPPTTAPYHAPAPTPYAPEPYHSPAPYGGSAPFVHF